MVLPLIMRSTEEALKSVPDSYREGSFGLGAGKLRTVFRIVLPRSGAEGDTSLPQSSLELAESLEQLRWLENGYSIKVGISEVETIGIDTPQDLARAEEFLRNQQEAL